VKIGDLEREYQVWRDHGDPRKGTGSGPDTWFWCTRCGDVLPSDAPPEEAPKGLLVVFRDHPGRPIENIPACGRGRGMPSKSLCLVERMFDD